MDVRPQIHDRSTFNQCNIQTALKAVKDDGIPINCAGHQFGIPDTNLRDRISGRVKSNAAMDSLPLFSTTDEDCLAKHIVQMASFGYGLTRAQVLEPGPASQRVLDLAKLLTKSDT